MADYYIAKKSNEKAIEYVEKAYKISNSKYHKEKLDTLKE